MINMIKNLSTNHMGMVLGLCGYTAFAFSDTTSKIVAPHYPALQVACIHAALASLVLYFFANKLGGWRGWNNVRELWFHGTRTFLNIALNILMLFSFTILPLASIYAMIFSKPFFAAILSILFYRETVGLSRWASIIIGFIGVLIILQPTPDNFQADLLIPLFCAFLAAIMFILSRSLQEASNFVMGFYPLIGTFIFCLPFAIIGTPDFKLLIDQGQLEFIASKDLIWAHVPIFFMGGIFIATGIVCVSLAFRLATASLVAPFLYTEMIWGIAFGYLIFGDLPTSLTLIGSAVIIASGLYLILVEKWRRPAVGAAPASAIPRPLRISNPQPWNFFDPEETDEKERME